MTNTTHTAARIRPGFYEYRLHSIERLDERAEVYRDGGIGTISDYYGMWRVVDEVCGDTWDVHFATLRDAKEAIDGAAQG